MRKSLINISFIFLLIGFKTYSQNSHSDTFFAEINSQFGIPIIHSTNYHLISGHIKAFGGSFGKFTNGNKQWHGVYNFPEIAVDYFCLYLANPQQLGYAHGLVPNMRFGLYRKGNFGLKLKAGLGLGYITKPYDSEINYKNNLNGSHINAVIYAGLFSDIKIAPKIHLKPGLDFTHFSNGEYQLPNDGLNTVTALLGLQYAFSSSVPMDLPQRDPFRWFDPGALRVLLVPAFGIKETRPFLGPKYKVFSFMAAIDYPINKAQSLTTGLDLFYDEHSPDQWASMGIQINSPFDCLEIGFNIGQNLVFSKLTVVAQIGTYLYNKNKSEIRVYNRFGFRYQFSEKFLFNFSHKSHFFFKGDYLEWGIGYTVNTSK